MRKQAELARDSFKTPDWPNSVMLWGEYAGLRALWVTLHPLIKWRSADPTTSFLTEAMMKRASMQAIRDQFPDVQAEILRNLSLAESIQGDRFFDVDITTDGKWNRIYLQWYDQPTPGAVKNFPVLTQILRAHPDIRLAMVSILEPGATIKAHYGPLKGSIRVHWGIETPNCDDCYINVGGQQHSWKDGEMVAFDDTYLHYVRNATENRRVVLFLDLERKMKTERAQRVLQWANDHFVRPTGKDIK